MLSFSVISSNISVLSTYYLKYIVSPSYTIETKDIQTFDFEATLSETTSIDNVLFAVDLLKRKTSPKSKDGILTLEFVNQLDVVNLLSVSVFKHELVLSAVLVKALS